MPEITKAQAKKFLMEISCKDNIAIIHHDDADGFCSAILFYDHCISRGAKVKTFSYYLSETSLEKLPLQPFNKIILTDIASKVIQNQIKSIKGKQIFYTDHHQKFPLPKKVLTLTTPSCIPSSRTAYELISGKKWLSLIGTIADAGDTYKENNKFIKDSLKELKLTLEEFKEKYTYPFSDTIIYFSKSPNKAFSKLIKIKTLSDIAQLEKYAKPVEKEIQKHIRNFKKKSEKIGEVNLYFLKPKFPLKGIVSTALSMKYPKEIFIFLTKKGKFIEISSRYQSSKANLPKLLETLTKDLPNSEAGGHLRASGGRIRAKDLKKFKQNIRNYYKVSGT